jgi:hypothetical protein
MYSSDHAVENCEYQKAERPNTNDDWMRKIQGDGLYFWAT